MVLTTGLGEMGGAQPLAVKMNGGVAIIVDVDKKMIERRIRLGYLDTWTDSLDKAFDLAHRYLERDEGYPIGLLGNVSDIYWQLYKEGFKPDVVTDQTPLVTH